VRIPIWLIVALAVAALALPLVVRSGYVLQTLGIGWLYAVLAISLTLVAGTAGMISLGQAGLLAIGAYASGLLAIRLHLPVSVTIAAAGVITALIGTLIIFPAFRLRGHYVTIATLGVGEIVTLTILNWDSLTNGPVGLTAVPPLSAFGVPLISGTAIYEVSLVALIILALIQWRLLSSHLGRTLRAIRDDDVAARSYGIALDRYKGLAFGVAGFTAGIAGALMGHIFSYVNHETFTSQTSLLALTMVILGGLGNVPGAILGAVALVSLPELFRVLAEYRMLIYGIALLLLIRFRPQGLLGTV
jgi:branched-chain amino acid transport system permease protein